jgi:hypothetical protein
VPGPTGQRVGLATGLRRTVFGGGPEPPCFSSVATGLRRSRVAGSDGDPRSIREALSDSNQIGGESVTFGLTGTGRRSIIRPTPGVRCNRSGRGVRPCQGILVPALRAL